MRVFSYIWWLLPLVLLLVVRPMLDICVYRNCVWDGYRLFGIKSHLSFRWNPFSYVILEIPSLKGSCWCCMLMSHADAVCLSRSSWLGDQVCFSVLYFLQCNKTFRKHLSSCMALDIWLVLYVRLRTRIFNRVSSTIWDGAWNVSVSLYTLCWRLTSILISKIIIWDTQGIAFHLNQD